ncbi:MULTISPECIES: hypothetical protein [unclassified Candidatus Frackibacter]|nr:MULTISPECIES: hypothetical protein [unclassified Candidatus Frackibacter]SDC58974.1 hypothetical protein SAMN04515661_1151 [Candidatus Frackibacter sp. WG11]SEM42666.1 hypothetical protein SAMN04488698_103155 [Candidatus Frackibacter sp. WG12]SFL85551.1 hypothetical protein SAMN04488699_11662 [Candidatus Frackibacter sp. WG13]
MFKMLETLEKKQGMDAKLLANDPLLFYSKIIAMTAGAFALGRMIKK